MRHFLLGTGILMLAALPVAADPAPTQTPAQLDASAPASTAAQMPSQEDKAAVRQTGKAEVAANEAASNTSRKSGGMITDQELQQKEAVDNGHNDGGAATSLQVPVQTGKAPAKQVRKAKVARNAPAKSARKAQAAITDQELEQKKPLDNGRNDGGMAPEQVTP
jgi:hypothetical protein